MPFSEKESSNQDQEQAVYDASILEEADMILGALNKNLEGPALNVSKELAKSLQRLESLYEQVGLSPAERQAPEAVNEVRFWFNKEYEKQWHVLNDVGILKTLESGRFGIEGIDGAEYPVPSQEELGILLEQNRGLIEKKKEQGFTKMLLVPFGSSLDALAKTYGQRIVEHFKQGTLKDSQGKLITNLAKKSEGSSARNDATGDNEYYPLWKWDKYQGADETGALVYHPKQFDQTNHGGKTKNQIITSEGAWTVIFTEATPNIPRENPEIQGGRIQLDSNGSSIREYIEGGEDFPSPREYKEALEKGEMYQGESGMTPEEWIMAAITRLEETGEVMGDYQNDAKDKIDYLIEAYFPASDLVPSACWIRDSRQAYLSRRDVGRRLDHCGVRPTVRIKKKP